MRPISERSYEVGSPDGHVYRQNRSHLRKSWRVIDDVIVGDASSEVCETPADKVCNSLTDGGLSDGLTSVEPPPVLGECKASPSWESVMYNQFGRQTRSGRLIRRPARLNDFVCDP